MHEPLLSDPYPLVDLTPESPSTYSLCYGCHDREIVLGDLSFPHAKHVRESDETCGVCHDPHGSRTYTHLINFMRFDVNGSEVVSPSATTGRLEFMDLGDGHGLCFVSCHGSEHGPKEY
jgi:hypothetical protein